MQSHSQAYQDVFAHAMLRKKTGTKTYLELGSFHPMFGNNTYMLEKDGWDGVSYDINDHGAEFKEHRKNRFIREDVTGIDFNYTILSKPFYCNTIDYLSFDIDEATEKTLDNFPLDTVKFNTITFEHDAYQNGPRLRDKSRELFRSKGYQLVCADVICQGYGAFEDWWVTPNGDVDMNLVEKITCSNTESGKIAAMIQDVVVGGW